MDFWQNSTPLLVLSVQQKLAILTKTIFKNGNYLKNEDHARNTYEQENYINRYCVIS